MFSPPAGLNFRIKYCHKVTSLCATGNHSTPIFSWHRKSIVRYLSMIFFFFSQAGFSDLGEHPQTDAEYLSARKEVRWVKGDSFSFSCRLCSSLPESINIWTLLQSTVPAKRLSASKKIQDFLLSYESVGNVEAIWSLAFPAPGKANSRAIKRLLNSRGSNDSEGQWDVVLVFWLLY